MSSSEIYLPAITTFEQDLAILYATLTQELDSVLTQMSVQECELEGVSEDLYYREDELYEWTQGLWDTIAAYRKG